MAINKKLIHFNTFENFNSKKLSANIENTQYTLGVDGDVTDGEPDVKYQSICWIKDVQKIWTHSTIYNCSDLISGTNIKTINGESILGNGDIKISANQVTLTINLLKGYTWVSFYINVTLEDVQKALGTNGISISTASVGNDADLFSNYDSETGTWSGDLTELDFTKMYWIKTNEKDTIELSGELLNVEDYTITLNPGWNLIGYPSNEIIDALTALSALGVVQEGDIIKTYNYGSLQYVWGQWCGTLDVMIPGYGYQYFNTSEETKTFKFPSRLDIRLSQKQDKLVSGTNIKTVNGTSILGSGDIVILSDANIQAVDTSETIDDVETNTYVKYVTLTLTEELKSQVRTNIGAVASNEIDLSNYYTKSEIDAIIGDINSILESIINS